MDIDQNQEQEPEHHQKQQPPSTAPSTTSPPDTPSDQMHLDLSNLPPPPSLITPSPPSNTLLITQLTNPAIFEPTTLSQIHILLSSHLSSDGTGLHTFTPLRSLRRIIISLPTTEAAISLRQMLDGESILGCRARVYFGAETPVDKVYGQMDHLKAPDAGKLFFISPPPSPPAGWVSRNEDPPNREVHAGDLRGALERLKQSGSAEREWEEDDVAGADIMETEADVSTAEAARRREGLVGKGSNKLVVYHPEDHGSCRSLPAVLVEDVSSEEDDVALRGERRMLTHTARPPVELMGDHEDEGMDMS